MIGDPSYQVTYGPLPVNYATALTVEMATLFAW
jgi:hypothetical protein